MNQYEKDIEFEQMREQISLLKQTLDKKIALNEKAVRRAMAKSMSSYRRKDIGLIILALLSLPAVIILSEVEQLISPALCFVSIAFMLIAISYTLFTHQILKPEDIVGDKPLEVIKKIANLKQMSVRWLYFSIPFLMLWVPWFAYEATSAAPTPEIRLSFLSGFGVGLLLGGVYGIIHFRRSQRILSDMEQQIRDLIDVN